MTSGEYPVALISVTDDGSTMAAFAANCPEEAVQWGGIDDMHIVYSDSTSDATVLHPISGRSFIQRVDIPPEGTSRIALYDAQGKELPEELTGQPGGGGTRTYDGVTPVACVLVLLVGAVVALVRFVRLRRKAQTLRQEADEA